VLRYTYTAYFQLLLGCDTACRDKRNATFRGNVMSSSSIFRTSYKKERTIRSLERSVSDFSLARRHVPQEPNPQVHISVREPYNKHYYYFLNILHFFKK
jgi:hypothetical protein